jgi:hypothetical protein
MSYKLLLSLVAMLAVCPVALAGGGADCASGNCATGACDGRCGGGCDDCATCRVTVSSEKVKKHCWEVKCEQICIPPIQFPWQKCNKCGCKSCSCENPAGCGRVITVRRIVPREYECQECKYDWKVEGRCKSCGSGKASAGKTDGGKQVTPAPPVPHASRTTGELPLEAERWSTPGVYVR